MTLRSLPIVLAGLFVASLFVCAPPDAAHAQDRGAPLFGPGPGEDTVAAEPSYAGRLWSLATPPLERFQERYGVDADSAWATHLRRGIVRLPDCTAALVSAEGLALTTDQCIQQYLEPGDNGQAFVARQSGGERQLSSVYADRLLGVRTVTDEVRSVQEERDMSAAEAMDVVAKRLEADGRDGRRVKVTSIAAGAAFEASVYRRYQDVRLVFRPERGVSAFGGIEAHRTYPQYALDVAVLRIYGPNGRPLQPDHYFELPSETPRPGDVVFSVGHSRETRRAESANQLALRRDVVLPAEIERMEAWTSAVEAHVSDAGSPDDRWLDTLDAARRTAKHRRAQLEALESSYVMRRLERRDRQFRQQVQKDSELGVRYGGLLDSLAAVQKSKRDLASGYRAFAGLGEEGRASPTLQRALWTHRASASDAPRSDSLWNRARAVEPIPADIDVALLASRLRALVAHYGGESAAARRLLNGFSPEERAREIVTGSVFSGEERWTAISGEGLEGVPSDDPALRLVDVFADEYASFRDEWAALRRTERSLTNRLARAGHEVGTIPMRPAGGEGLRLTDGRLLGYPYNGTQAPSFTTFFGLYGQSEAFDGEGPWALPSQWTEASGRLDRSTALNRVASTDPAAGIQGAPLLNRHLEIVGVLGGTNIQGAGSEYIFLPERMRTVAVDLGGLREALRSVYRAEELANELAGSTVSAGANR